MGESRHCDLDRLDGPRSLCTRVAMSSEQLATFVEAESLSIDFCDTLSPFCYFNVS